MHIILWIIFVFLMIYMVWLIVTHPLVIVDVFLLVLPVVLIQAFFWGWLFGISPWEIFTDTDCWIGSFFGVWILEGTLGICGFATKGIGKMCQGFDNILNKLSA